MCIGMNDYLLFLCVACGVENVAWRIIGTFP